MAYGMPRLDLSASARDPLAYRSGFWGLAGSATGDEHRDLGLSSSRPLDGGTASAELGRVRARRSLPEPAPTARWRRLRSAAATAERGAVPRRDLHGDLRAAGDLFERQLESIRAQTHPTGSACISDDCSAPVASRRSRRSLGDDPRSSSRARRGGSASTATSSARWRWCPPAPRFVALADQDDGWHPDKLETLLGEIGAAQLVYSDARIVAPDGEVIPDTYWARRAQQPRRPALAAGRQLRDGRRVAVPRATCSTTRCRSRRPSSRTSTTTGSRGRARARRDRATSTARSTTTSSTARRARARRRQPDDRPARALRVVRLRSLRERVRLWRLHYFVDACGCCSSRRSCGCAAATA